MGNINLDIIGKKFNKLTVLEYISLNKYNKALFKCKCDCGDEKILIGSEVKSGAIKSCGCYAGNINEKICSVCNNKFQPTGRCAKYCNNCEDEAIKLRQRNYMKKFRFKIAKENGTLDRYGVGKGGNNKKGKDSPYYKNGIGYFHKRSKEIKKERRYCERCNKDLKYSKNGFWCVHHKDHNRDNNIDLNFELLCKKCHQIEHKCWKSFNVKNNSE